jgi:arabinogalactan endo-1,4-beta-galactosidase
VAKDIAIGTAFDNMFCSPLDFKIMSSHNPFFQSELNDRLSYELTFNNYGKVVVSTDTATSYTVSDIHLEFEVLTSPDLATMIKNRYNGQTAVLYDRVIRHSKESLNKSDTIWNITMAPQAKSNKGILILFVDPAADGGVLRTRGTLKSFTIRRLRRFP